MAEMYVGDDVSPDFYGWVFPKFDHVGVGTGTVVNRPAIKDYQVRSTSGHSVRHFISWGRRNKKHHLVSPTSMVAIKGSPQGGGSHGLHMVVVLVCSSSRVPLTALVLASRCDGLSKGLLPALPSRPVRNLTELFWISTVTFCRVCRMRSASVLAKRSRVEKLSRSRLTPSRRTTDRDESSAAWPSWVTLLGASDVMIACTSTTQTRKKTGFFRSLELVRLTSVMIACHVWSLPRG